MSSNHVMYFLSAAVVGIVSAAGLFLVDHLRQKRHQHTVDKNLARIDQQLSGIQRELEQMRQLRDNFHLQHSHGFGHFADLPDLHVFTSLQPDLTYRVFIRNAQRLKKNRRPAGKALSSVSSASDEYNSTLEADSSDLEFYDLSEDEETVQSSVSLAQLNEVLKEVDDQLNSASKTAFEAALQTLRKLDSELPENAEVKWRISKAHYKIACSFPEMVGRKEFIERAIAIGKTSLELNPDSADAHMWYAILVGLHSRLQPIKEKIADGFAFKKHLDIALTLRGEDPTLHHLLGQFAYEAASLKWYERKVASTFFAEPPNATFDEALEHALAAERINKEDWKENKLLVAQCQIALGRYSVAVQSLEQAAKMQDLDALDPAVDDKIKMLLKQYSSYR